MSIYYCTKDSNTCPRKDECERYVFAEGKNHATLFKLACTNINNYILFIQAEKDKEGEDV